MHRRSFLVAVAILIAAPLVAEAQPAQRLSRVGVLAAGSAEEATNVAFFERMRELGYVEGQTVVFDRRFATGRIEQLSAFATQIVAANPDVIYAPVTPAALAARKVTKTIPIVFAVSADPIDAGLVTSLREPGGNITGIINMNVELAAKRLELLRQVAPRISRIAVFSNLDNVPDRQQVNALRDTAAKVAVAIVPIDVRTENDYNIAFERPETQSAHAIMILPSPLNIRFRPSAPSRLARERMRSDHGAVALDGLSHGTHQLEHVPERTAASAAMSRAPRGLFSDSGAFGASDAPSSNDNRRSRRSQSHNAGRGGDTLQHLFVSNTAKLRMAAYAYNAPRQDNPNKLLEAQGLPGCPARGKLKRPCLFQHTCAIQS